MGTADRIGPDYVRAEEWAIRVRRVRRRRTIALAAAAVAAGALAAWWVRAPGLKAIALLNSAARIAGGSANGHLVVWSIDESGSKRRSWEEWSAGELCRAEFERTGKVLLHRNGEDLVLDPLDRAWYRFRFERRTPSARRWMQEVLGRAVGSGELELLPKLDSARATSRFRFTEGAERFTLWIEDHSAQPLACLVEWMSQSGWKPVVEVAAELGTAHPAGLYEPDSADIERYGEVREPAKAGSGPGEVVARLPIGRQSAIEFGHVGIAADGTVCVVVNSQATEAKPYLEDARGVRYFREETSDSWEGTPAIEYRFVPVSPESAPFEPRTVRVHFPASPATPAGLPPRDLAVHEVRFEAPSAAAAPNYRQTGMDADLAAIYDSEVTRGEHLAVATRLSDGRLRDVASNEIVFGVQASGGVDPEDRARAEQAYLRALRVYRETGVHGRVTPASVWFRLFKLAEARFDERLSQAYLASARAALKRGAEEPDADAIVNTDPR